MRLKGNLIIPNTVTFPDESVFEVAKRRGVIVTSQHFTILGVNTWRWPTGVPYSFDRDREIQEYVWSASISEYEGRESVWTIGYRGLNDYPFWDDEPSFNTTEKRCALVSDAMKAQANLVRGTTGRENDECVTYLWSEMLELYLSGGLKIPDGTTRVFADDGGSGTFDPRVVDQLRPGDGAYYHIQMEYPGKLSQLTEMVPPKVFLNGVRPFVKKKATSLFMLNVSDLKPSLFMIDFIFKFLWDPEPYMNSDPKDLQSKALSNWANRFFTDSSLATEVADIMNMYFTDVDYIAGNGADGRSGEQHLAYFPRNLLSAFYHSSFDGSKTTSPSEAFSFINSALPVLGNLYGRASSLHQELVKSSMESPQALQELQFFESNVMIHVGIHWFACKSINSTATAVKILNTTSTTKGSQNAIRYIQDSIDALEALFELERLAEHQKWRGLYGYDILDDFFLTACFLRLTLFALQTKSTPDFESSLCYLQSGAKWKGGTGPWSPWFTYGNTSENFPFLNPSAKFNMDNIVRITCELPCKNNAVGGSFEKEAVLSMAIKAGLEIRYTLDGSEPNSNSMKFDSPIKLSGNTTVSAKGFGPGRTNENLLVTKSTFTMKT